MGGMTPSTRPDQQTGPDQTGWRRFLDRLPLRLALTAIGLVWLAGCVWSFEEQTAFAWSKRFNVPELLPLVVDGMAVSMAAVAWAASLDARPAVFARIGTALAVACSAGSNAAWAWERSTADPGTIALAAGVPIVANLAFEVLLAELRRQVLRHRGLPAPVALPYPRLVRIVLAPWSTFVVWRRLVLAATDPAPAFEAAQTAARTRPARRTTPDRRADDEQTGQTPANQTATVTPITAGRTRPAAVRNARVLADRYGDEVPAQKVIERDLGWGAERTRAALAELTRMRQSALEGSAS